MNIHILKGNFTERNNGVSQGNFRVVFHIPLSSPAVGIGETTKSVVPDIEQAEIDALAASTLIEVDENWNYQTNKTDDDYRQQLKDRWNSLNTSENARYNFEYKYWKLKFDATT